MKYNREFLVGIIVTSSLSIAWSLCKISISLFYLTHDGSNPNDDQYSQDGNLLNTLYNVPSLMLEMATLYLASHAFISSKEKTPSQKISKNNFFVKIESKNDKNKEEDSDTETSALCKK